MKKILLLHPTQGNLGDGLIWVSCFQAISRVIDEETIINYRPMIHAKLINLEKYDTVILCGGPILGHAKHQFHNFFSPNSLSEKTKILPFGIGTQVRFNEKNPFDEKSKDLLTKIHDNINFSSVRDNETKKHLNDIGIYNTKVTGCPSLFLLPNTRVEIKQKQIQKVMVTLKTGRPETESANIQLLETVSNMFKGKAQLILSFHDTRNIEHVYNLINEAIKRGFRVFSAVTPMNMVKAYMDNIDLHIGFRLHAHIPMLSMGKPSFLVWCDTRAKSFSETFGLTSDVHYDEINRLPEIVNHEIINNYPSFKNFTNNYAEKLQETKNFLSQIGPHNRPFDGNFLRVVENLS